MLDLFVAKTQNPWMVRLSWRRFKLLSPVPYYQTQKLSSLLISSSSSSSYMALTQPFYDTMKSLTTPTSLPNARKLHAQIISIGLSSSTFLQNNLLNTYLNCSSLLDARNLFDEIPICNEISGNMMINGYCKFGNLRGAEKVFDEMPVSDTTTWNTLLSGYYQNDRFQKAVKLFLSMLNSSNCEVNLFSFTCAIKSCSMINCMKLALQLLGLVEKTEFRLDPQVRQALIDMFVKCGEIHIASKLFDEMPNPNLSCWNCLLLGYSKSCSVTHALEMFDKMPEQDAVSWNTIISMLAQKGQKIKALNIFSQMNREGIKPDSTTYTCTLSACASISNLRFGTQIHARILKTLPKIDKFIGSALVDLYAKSGSLKLAKIIFNSLDNHSTYSWTAIINGFSQTRQIKESIELFNQMREEFHVLDEFTIVTLISACSNMLNSGLGNQLHPLALKTGLISAIAVSNSLIAFYAKCNNIHSSKLVFDFMPYKDVISWTSMITAYSQVGEVENARELFDEMPLRNIVTWNAMLGTYIHHNHENEGIKMYITMLKENTIKPDCVTFVTLFKACADVASVKIGNQIFGQTIKLGIDMDLSIANSIITMYSECGRLKEAKQIFDFICQKDIISWNAMITAYSHHGMGIQAIETFELMLKDKIKPDYISFVAILSSCCHAGLVEQGKYYFDSMTKVHEILPGLEHYSCMVDLLGRTGLLEEAKGIIVNMPIEPSAEVWGVLLASCKLHGNADLAEYAAKHLFELNSNDSGSYMLLSKMYKDSGSSDESARVRKLMRDKGVKKKPGYSWIEVDNKVHLFTADESCHPQIVEIKRKLEGLIEKITEVGYVKNDGTELVKYHSEKLAVVFGLMSLPNWMPIYIMKNLRICNDCHVVIKLVSLVSRREFVVRDAVRFHHFKDGSCSCGDYW